MVSPSGPSSQKTSIEILDGVRPVCRRKGPGTDRQSHRRRMTNAPMMEAPRPSGAKPSLHTYVARMRMRSVSKLETIERSRRHVTTNHGLRNGAAWPSSTSFSSKSDMSTIKDLTCFAQPFSGAVTSARLPSSATLMQRNRLGLTSRHSAFPVIPKATKSVKPSLLLGKLSPKDEKMFHVRRSACVNLKGSYR